MIDKRMQKWKLGLLVLAAFSVGLLAYVILQANNTKIDRATTKQAETIAETLNGYINRKQAVPVSLTAAGVTDIPSTVSYMRHSNDSYEFCVTYKTASTDVSAQVQGDLYRATVLRGYSSESGSSSSYGSESPSALYITGDHKAGKQCQTVKPYLYSSDDYNDYYNNDGSGSSSGDSSDDSSSSDYFTQ